MGCGCGGGAQNSMVYQVTWTDAAGETTVDFVDTIGAYRMLKATVQAADGSVKSAIQVPRKKMEEAQQNAGVSA